jgi:ABC-2 type transport system permease protein
MRLVTATYLLMLRSLRETVRQPGVEIQNIFIPLFFFAVTVGAIGNFSGRAFGVDNYTGFQMPVALLQGVAGSSGFSAFAIALDIERGYFDKLLLTPTPRLALITGRLAGDAVRAMALTTLIVVIGLVFGAGMEAGPLGVVMLIVMAGFFAIAYAGFGIALALRTGSVQAAQAGFLVFFPLLFLSPAFAPKEVFAGWLEFLATVNPVTYVLQAQRSLILEGWEWDRLGEAALAIAGMTAVTLTAALLALRYRVR